MPNLFQNPFDSIVRAAYSGAPPYSQSSITPPYLPSQRTTYDELGNDPAYTQLEEELKQILRAKRNTGTKAKIGNVLRAGLSAASQPNRAFGGPMDMLAAISGGMSGAQDQDILQQKLFNEEQARQANSIQGMLEERRRKTVAEAQSSSYNARAAYDNWRMNKPTTGSGYTFLTGSDGRFLKANKDTGQHELIGDPRTPPETEAQKAAARLKAKVDKIAEVEAEFNAGKIDEAGRRSRLKVLGADIAPEEQKNTWSAAAVVSLTQKGVLDPDPLQVMTEAARLQNLAKPKSKGGKTKTQGQLKNETLAGLHANFQALGNLLPGDDAGRKKYYQSMVEWLNTPEVREGIPAAVFGDVLKAVETNAGRTLGRSRGSGLRNDLGEVEKNGVATPPVTPLTVVPNAPKPKTVRMKAPDGTIKPVPADQVEYYKKRGATVVTGGMA